jgi:hypothetical protein
MIKINLATRKQAIASAGGGGGGAGLTKGLQGGLKNLSFSPDLLKELPIAKIILMIVVGYGANWWVEARKASELAIWETEKGKVIERQNQLKAELKKTDGFEAMQKQLLTDEQLMKTKIETVQKLINDRQVPPKLLSTLSSCIPPDVWLNDVHIGDDGVKIAGLSQGYNPISDFMKSLSESVYFTDLKLQGTTTTPEGGKDVNTFDLIAKRR